MNGKLSRAIRQEIVPNSQLKQFSETNNGRRVSRGAFLRANREMRLAIKRIKKQMKRIKRGEAWD